ncbi:MAG: zinc metalloprotease [Nocardioidaceae bacterium]
MSRADPKRFRRPALHLATGMLAVVTALDMAPAALAMVAGPASTETELAARCTRESIVHATAPASWSQVSRVGQRIGVRVHVHVLRSKSGGGVSMHRIERQVHVLNRAYAGRQNEHSARSRFRFELGRVDVTVNRAWQRLTSGSLNELRAKRSLHRGNADALNLYIGDNAERVLGWATTPADYRNQPALDGVVIARRTLPGGAEGHYSAGDTAVHETGHWLGLLHTFAGACSARGDLVADTPAHAAASISCGRRRNTCAAAGVDPVHNFMNYVFDACMNQFTSEQVARMFYAWQNYRATGGN